MTTYANPEELDWVTERAGRLASRAGLADLGRRLRAASAPATEGPRRVVIAGEVKRGKSSLVNALVERPLLSPVGDDVVTATYLVFLPDERDRAVAVLMDAHTGTPERVEIGLDELRDYVSVDATHEGVIGVEVYLTTPLLRSMELMDTPGVGGLCSGHNAVTMSSLDTAHAFLFVMDAGAPLSEPELTFLREVARHNEGVVLVMTKTDLYPEWEAIREDDRALIATHVPALAGAPIVPLSSRLADHAVTLPSRDPAVVAQLRGLSGVEGLAKALEATIAARSATLSRSGRLYVLSAVLTELRARLSDSPEALSSDPARLSTLVAERDRLATFLSDPHIGALHVNRRMDRLRRDAARDFNVMAAAVVQRWSAAIDDHPAAELKEIPTLLQGELAHLVTDSVDKVDHELSEIIDELESRIGSTTVLTSLRRTVAERTEVRLTEHQAAEDWTAHVVAVGSTTVTTTSTLAFYGFFTSGPIGIAIGIAAIATRGLMQLMNSRRTNRRESLHAWLPRVEIEVGRAFEGQLDTRLDELEQLLNAELPRLLEERIAEIERLTSSYGPGAQDTRATSLAATTLADVDALIQRVDSLLTSAPRG